MSGPISPKLLRRFGSLRNLATARWLRRMRTKLAIAYRVLAIPDEAAEQMSDLASGDLVSVVQRRALELGAVLSAMTYGIYICDATGQITFINEAGAKILGIAEQTRLPRRLEELDRKLRPDRARELPTRAGQALTVDDYVLAGEAFPLARTLSGESFAGLELSFWNHLLGRMQYVQVSGAPIHDGQGAPAGAVIVAADVTGRVEMNRRRDEMVYVTSHELRAPLTSIRGYVQLAMRQLINDPSRADVAQHLGQVNRQIDTMVEMINRLLDVARIETGHLRLDTKDFDVVALTAEAIDKMKTTSDKHRLRLFMSEEPIVLHADPARVEQVLVNLIANAIKYSPDGGDVDVRVGRVGPTVLVSVKDEGIGIPKDKQDRIFEKLYRVETEKTKTVPGSGLGLYISRAIVEQHGGEMHFESEDGQGSTFYFMLPEARE